MQTVTRFKWGRILAATIAAMWASPGPALACSVCYGEPDSPATKGLTWAIVLLAMVVVGVLMGIVGFFVAANKNATVALNQSTHQD